MLNTFQFSFIYKYTCGWFRLAMTDTQNYITIETKMLEWISLELYWLKRRCEITHMSIISRQIYYVMKQVQISLLSNSNALKIFRWTEANFMWINFMSHCQQFFKNSIAHHSTLISDMYLFPTYIVQTI